MAASRVNNVLSDVHICASENNKCCEKLDQMTTGRYFSRFYFHLPEFLKISQSHDRNISSDLNICPKCLKYHSSPGLWSSEGAANDTIEQKHSYLDEDGDLVLVRRKRIKLMSSFACSNIEFKSTETVSCPDVPECTDAQCNECDKLCESSEEETQVSFSRHANSCDTAKMTDGEGAKASENTQSLCQSSQCVKYKPDSSCGWSFSGNDDIPNYGVVTIEHKMDTPLTDVGFQVWSGALLMCDYLIHNNADLANATVLDLGAGTGITSIISAMFAPRVICTDYQVDLIDLAERNWQRNKDLLPQVKTGQIFFKVLDWTKDIFSAEAADDEHCLGTSDIQFMEDATVILGAEVVYDDDITDAFFQTIYQLLLRPPAKTVLMTVERRIVFSVDSQDICSPAYEHFRENLEDLSSIDEGPVHFRIEQIISGFPQYFQYQRTNELQIWKISSSFLDQS